MMKYRNQTNEQSLSIDKIEKRTVVELVMEKMKELIASKHFKVGDRIPPELELANMFGIARSSIREAMKIFHYLGIVESQAGRGTFICDRSTIATEALAWSVLLGEDEVFEVLQLRELLEEAGLRKLAHQYSKDPSSLSHVIESLEREAEKLTNAFALNDVEAKAQADYKFHGIIIEASNNKVLMAIYHTVQAFLYEVLKRTFTPMDTSGKNLHRDFIKTIESGNLDAMIQELNRHIRHVSDTLEAGYGASQ